MPGNAGSPRQPPSSTSLRACAALSHGNQIRRYQVFSQRARGVPAPPSALSRGSPDPVCAAVSGIDVFSPEDRLDRGVLRSNGLE